MRTKIIYYKDELNDNFSGDNITPRKIDGSYKYLREGLGCKILHILCYRIIALPLAKIYMKLYFRHRVFGKELLRQTSDRGFFLYGNHTHFLCDALVPPVINAPRQVSTLVHPNNVSMPVLGKITPYLGALPLPDDTAAAKNFLEALGIRLAEGDCIMIYPEAHIWPYYTDIRPFSEHSFKYPVRYDAPVYCITNTYQRRGHSRRPRMVTYIDGPFYARPGLKDRENKKLLRDMVYRTMKKRAKNNNMEIVQYRKAVSDNDKSVVFRQ